MPRTPALKSLKRLLLSTPGFEGLCRRLTKRHVRVLMYHRFTLSEHPHPRRLKADEFEWQLNLISTHHTAWTPSEHLHFLRSPARFDGAPPVVITVDDGYGDFAQIAWPRLDARNLPAMVFLATGFISGETWFWWDRLAWFLEALPSQEQTIIYGHGLRVTGNPGNVSDFWRMWNSIADELSVMNDEEKESTLLQVARSFNIEIPRDAPADFAAMTWNQIRDCSGSRICWGAHTVTHPVLSRVDHARAAAEITESGRHIQKETGMAPEWFCYTQGQPHDFNSEVTKLVREAGYSGCYTAYPDPEHDGDPFTLPRYCPDNDRILFRWTLCGAEYLVARIRSAFRG